MFPNPDAPESGEMVGYIWTAKSGTVSITHENGKYTVVAECKATLNDNPRLVNCKASFTGDIPYVDYYAYTPLSGDRKVEIKGVSGRYYPGSYNIVFYNVPLDKDGFVVGPGDLLSFECYTDETTHMDLDALCGEYTPVNMFKEGPVKGRFWEGTWYQFSGSMWGALGTALTVYNDDGTMLTGLATEGVVTFTKADKDGEYTVNFNVATPEKHKITATWTGRLGDFIDDQTAGVENIENDGFKVRGGEGFIEAPEGAEIYNLSGTKTGATSLPSGIYIVRLNGKSVKVMVK